MTVFITIIYFETKEAVVLIRPEIKPKKFEIILKIGTILEKNIIRSLEFI